MLTLLISWGALAVAVLLLAAMRKIAARGENDVLHVNNPAFATRQQGIAARLDRIDGWGKPLTVALALYGLGLLAWFLYSGWQHSQSLN